jgi:serine/threonine protein kinase
VFYDKYLPDWKGDIKVMELAWLGSLSRQKGVSANEMTVLIDQILDATGHLHVNGYTHRDIKPDNILINFRKPILAKLCDFGLTSNLCLKTFAGAKNFVAPKILKQKLPGLRHSRPIERQVSSP